jgi:hypothetical protein
MSPILEGIAMSMVAPYNELQCMPEVCYSVCVIIWQQFTMNCNVYICQKFVTLFVLITCVSFVSCCNEMSTQMN